MQVVGFSQHNTRECRFLSPCDANFNSTWTVFFEFQMQEKDLVCPETSRSVRYWSIQLKANAFTGPQSFTASARATVPDLSFSLPGTRKLKRDFS